MIRKKSISDKVKFFSVQLLFILLLPILCICQKIDSLEYGYGGGFSGDITFYKVVNSKIYKGNDRLEKKINAFALLKKKDEKLIYEKGKEILISSIEFMHPYNMYGFLIIYTSKKVKRISWGDISYELPEMIKEFKITLDKIIKASKFNEL